MPKQSATERESRPIFLTGNKHMDGWKEIIYILICVPKRHFLKETARKQQKFPSMLTIKIKQLYSLVSVLVT